MPKKLEWAEKAKTRLSYHETPVVIDGKPAGVDKRYHLEVCCPDCGDWRVVVAWKNGSGESIASLQCPKCDALAVVETESEQP